MKSALERSHAQLREVCNISISCRSTLAFSLRAPTRRRRRRCCRRGQARHHLRQRSPLVRLHRRAAVRTPPCAHNFVTVARPHPPRPLNSTFRRVARRYQGGDAARGGTQEAVVRQCCAAPPFPVLRTRSSPTPPPSYGVQLRTSFCPRSLELPLAAGPMGFCLPLHF